MPYIDGLPLSGPIQSTDLIPICRGSTGAAGTGITDAASAAQFAAFAGSFAAQLTNIAALQAATSGTVPGSLIYVEGYYTPGDAGAGLFRIGTTTTANGGTIINDSSGRSWYRDTNSGPYSVAWFGAFPDGATNYTTKIAAADAAARAAGQSLHFPGSATGAAYMVDALNISTHSQWFGDGQGVTIIQGIAGSTANVVQTTGFASLVGTNTAAGPYQWSIKMMTIDGNKAHRTGGDALALYSYSFTIEDVDVQNGATNCVYSEWATAPGVPVPAGGNSMESHWSRNKIFSAAQAGLLFNGPHDSIFIDTHVFINGTVGANFGQAAAYTAGGSALTNFHSYGNGSYGLQSGTILLCCNVESESNLSGGGIQLYGGGGAGAIWGSGILTWGNTGFGFEDNNGLSNIAGIHSHSNTGDGIDLFGSGTQLTGVISINNGGDGILTNTAAGETTIAGAQIYQNAGIGMAIQAGNFVADSLFVSANGGGGVTIKDGLFGVMLRGYINNNTGVGLAMGTLGSPGGNIFDLAINTTGGNTAYTGTIGNNFARIAATGTSTTPINSVQT